MGYFLIGCLVGIASTMIDDKYSLIARFSAWLTNKFGI